MRTLYGAIKSLQPGMGRRSGSKSDSSQNARALSSEAKHVPFLLVSSLLLSLPLISSLLFLLPLNVAVFGQQQRYRSSAASSTVSNINPQTIDQVISRLGTDFITAGKSDGLSIAVVKDGHLQLHHFGSVVREKNQLPTDGTVYEIGSISKVFTSLILGYAVTQGKVNPQDDIRRYLPGAYPNLAFEGAPVRLLDLADTTSALPDNLPDLSRAIAEATPEQTPFIVTKALRQYGEGDLLQDLRSVKLADRPGTVPRHSNVAAEVLAVILANIYGEAYSSLIQQHIEEPFRMQTGIDGSRVESLTPGYNAQHVLMPTTDQISVLAAGGLRYSLLDMSRFLVAELSAGNKAVQLTQRPVWGDPEKLAMGYGWKIRRDVDNRLRLSASGATFRCSSYMEMYPGSAFGIVALMNRSLPDTEGELEEFAEAAYQSIEGAPALKALQEGAKAGSYRHFQDIVANVRQKHPELHLTEEYVNRWGGQLLAEGRADAAVALFEYNTNRWPDSSDAFDSLGYGFQQLGNKPRAIAAYRKAIALNPKNGEALDGLQSLTR